MKRMLFVSAAAILFGAFVLGGSVTAARKVCDDGTFPPCNKPSTGEAASNNLSYPVIWSDGAMKPDFVPSEAAWVFAGVSSDEGGRYTGSEAGGDKVYCVGEDDIVPPATIPVDVLCYFGRKNEGLSEDTGQPVLSGEPKLWWLQQRQPDNQWQVFNAIPANPVVITGVDVGDLLESSISIKAKQIRTEFTLLKRVGTTEEFAANVFDGCTLDANDATAGTSPNNCFAAHGMSGAVPGTDQSIAETQGTDYADTGVLVDPRTVKTAKNYYDPAAVAIESDEPVPGIIALDPAIGMDATVYSGCARLVIQKVTGDTIDMVWNSGTDSVSGRWGPATAFGPPVVDINAWDGTYSAEINAGGSLIYGYNWNTKSFASGSGTYRLTFLLEGDRCGYDLNTVFDDTTLSVNVGERRPATLLSAADLAGLGATGGEGGAVYVDVDIVTGGGGGGGSSSRGIGGGSGGGRGHK